MAITDLSKTELRALLSNPGIDTSKPNFHVGVKLKPMLAYRKIVYPIIEEHCKDYISLDEFKNAHNIPHQVVKIILEKCA